MTNLRITRDPAIGLQRLVSFLLPAALALGAATLPAQQGSLAGHWRGVDGGTTFTIVIQPNGQYIQHAQSGTLMTRQSGQFRLLDAIRIALPATNSPARTPQIGRATPTTAGGYSANQHAGVPLGATNSIVFTGPNKIVFTDEKTHHSITLTRVP